MRKMQYQWTELSPTQFFGAEDDEPDTDPQEGAEDDDSGDESEEVDDKISPEYVAKLRKENAGRRISAKEATDRAEKAEAALAKIQKSEMSDLEAVKTDLETETSRADEAEKSALQTSSLLKTERIRNAVTMAALEAGFVDPSDALSMISQDDLVDDEGDIQPKTVKARLKALADKKPYLLTSHRPGSGDGGGRGKPRGAETFQEKEDGYLKKMTEQGGRISI